MQVPQIRITSQMAQISIKQTAAQLEQAQPKADMKIEQPPAKMQMQTRKGKLTIDQTKAWEDRQLMSTIRLNEIYAAESRKIAQEGVARRAEQGVALLDIHEGHHMFVEQAKENGHRQPKQLSLTYIPSPFAVKMHYERSELDLQIQAQDPKIDVRIQQPTLTVQRGGVEIGLEKQATLDIDFTNIYI